MNTWKTYSVEYTSEGVPFRTSITAQSYGEAHIRLADLKETGKIVGEMIAEYPANINLEPEL